MLRKIIGGLKKLTSSLKSQPTETRAHGSHGGHGAHGGGGKAKSGGPASGGSRPTGPSRERPEGGRPAGEPARSGGRPSHGGHGGQGSHGGRGERERDRGHGRGGRGQGRGERSSPAANEPRYDPPARPVAPPPPVPAVDPEHNFKKLGLCDAVVAAVIDKGYNDPTPIQAQAIPMVLAGGDMIGTAQTGTGKTAAFALPVLHRMGSHGKIRCLVLEPTRELALQVEEAFRGYAKYTDLRVCVVYGGVGYGKQREELQRGADIVVATPGRLLDLLGENVLTLRDLQVLVLDEVDRMLDMGFLPDVRRIMRYVPAQRQTLLFSATLPPEIQGLAQSVLTNPQTIEIGIRSSPAETVDHAFYPVVAMQKFDLMLTLLERANFKSVIVFSRTKMGADRIAQRLERAGHAVGVMHADRSQRERQEALEGFKSGKYQLLVATDLAARGLDIRGVTHVVNYDMPENPEDYVHRIGRTGRAQAEGDAYTLMTEDDIRAARAIERLIARPVPRRKVEGFNYTYSALFEAQAEPVVRPTSRLSRGRR